LLSAFLVIDLRIFTASPRFDNAGGRKVHRSGYPPAGRVVSPTGVSYHAPMQRILVAIGVLFVIAGLLWPWLAKLGLGRLPGDIRVESDSGGFYFPLTTCVIISLVLSLVIWFIRR